MTPLPVSEAMSTASTTAFPVAKGIAILWPVMSIGLMARKHEPQEPLTLGEEVVAKMSQRTLFILLGAAVAAGAGYMDLKTDARQNQKAIDSLVFQRAMDHDLLVKAVEGVDHLREQVNRREVKDVGRDSRDAARDARDASR